MNDELIRLKMSYRKRIVLLPGFGEDKRIFRKIAPYLSDYELLHVDYRSVLHRFTPENIELPDFISALHEHYGISQDDILIGHSLGGFISHRLRQQLGCDNCLIASFTNPKKIKLPYNYKKLAKWFTDKGGFTSIPFRQIVRIKYRNSTALPDLENSLEVFAQYGKQDIYKLIRLIQPRWKGWLDWLRPAPTELSPSLILHPQKDSIVAPPDEQHIKLPGNHFSPATHPEIVGRHLEAWLIRLKREKALDMEIEAEQKGVSGWSELRVAS